MIQPDLAGIVVAEHVDAALHVIHIDTTQFTVLMSSITALAAIVMPVVNSIVSTRSAERIKRAELYVPCALSALSEISARYQNLVVLDEDGHIHASEAWRVITSFQNFAVACYKIIPLIKKRRTRKRVTHFLDTIQHNQHCRDTQIDLAFDDLMIILADSVRP